MLILLPGSVKVDPNKVFYQILKKKWSKQKDLKFPNITKPIAISHLSSKIKMILLSV